MTLQRLFGSGDWCWGEDGSLGGEWDNGDKWLIIDFDQNGVTIVTRERDTAKGRPFQLGDPLLPPAIMAAFDWLDAA